MLDSGPVSVKVSFHQYGEMNKEEQCSKNDIIKLKLHHFLLAWDYVLSNSRHLNAPSLNDNVWAWSVFVCLMGLFNKIESWQVSVCLQRSLDKLLVPEPQNTTCSWYTAKHQDVSLSCGDPKQHQAVLLWNLNVCESLTLRAVSSHLYQKVGKTNRKNERLYSC